MKRWAIGFFLCYPLLPVAFICAMGLFEKRPIAMLAVLYYALLLASSWNLRRMGGWAGRWYLLAFAVTCVHLGSVGATFLRSNSLVGGDDFVGLILLTIPGVYVAATWAGAALALRLNRRFDAGLQLFAPLLPILGVVLGERLAPALLLLAFGGQGLHALFLTWKTFQHVENELFDIGLSPAEDTI